jgi:hypothetical protein
MTQEESLILFSIAIRCRSNARNNVYVIQCVSVDYYVWAGGLL